MTKIEWTDATWTKELYNSVKIFIGSWVLIMFMLMFNTWNGDPTIYFVYAKNLLNGHGLVFNIGYPSASFSSPLWLLMVTSCGADPVIVKILMLIIFTSGVMLITKSKGIVAGALTVYLSFIYCFTGYETSLIILGTGLLLNKHGWIGYCILTLTRPEAIILFPLFEILFKVKWTAMIPSIVYYTAIIIYAGIPESFIARAGNAPYWVEMRYIIIALPFILWLMEKLIQQNGWRQYVLVSLLVMGTFLKLPKINESFNSWTYRDIAPYVGKNDVLYTTEIQIKYWLNDSAMVVSKDGLLKDYRQPTMYLRSIYDTLQSGIFIKKPNNHLMMGLYSLP